MSAHFLDISVSQFRKSVDEGVFPEGTVIPGTTVVRWRRDELEYAIRIIFGLPAKDIDLPAAAGREWLDAADAH